MALRPLVAAAADPRRVQSAIAKGAAWLEGMQSSDGGWAAFDVDNTRAIVRDLPFCDFGEVIDPPSADVTAHVVEMFGALGRAGEAVPQRASAGCWTTRRPTARGSGAGASTTSTGPAPSCPRCRRRRADRPTRRSGGPCAGSSASRTRTAAGARTAAPTTTRRGSAAARARPRRPPGRCWRCTPPARRSTALSRPPRRRLAGRHPASGRRLGRAVPHRHRIPVGLLHQLPPVPADLPGDGARGMSAMSRGARGACGHAAPRRTTATG